MNGSNFENAWLYDPVHDLEEEIPEEESLEWEEWVDQDEERRESFTR